MDSHETAVTNVDLPTTITQLRGGTVEYRLDRQASDTVVVFHGGHMHASLALGESAYTSAGLSVLVPSRPGYGRTPLTAGPSPSAFADTTWELCRHLGIEQITAVAGISAGSHTAIAMAARHPRRVARLILQSAVGPSPWPDRRTRIAAHLAFNPLTEKATWAAIHTLIRRNPNAGLRMMMSSLSTQPAHQVVASLSPGERDQLAALFTRMHSGSGFRNDLRPTRDLTGKVTQPTLVIASPHDASVPFAHAEALTAAITGADLIASNATSHFLWFSPDYPDVTSAIQGFLAGTRPPMSP